jgi:hypothetical protein
MERLKHWLRKAAVRELRDRGGLADAEAIGLASGTGKPDLAKGSASR